MICPRCGSPLDERERDGVMIDVCTRCRGIWLDRGELEKLIAFAADDAARYDGLPPPSGPPPRRQDGFFPPPDARQEGYVRRQDDSDAYGVPVGRDGKPRKRKWYESFGDIFD